jgi:hypothetical protein
VGHIRLSISDIEFVQDEIVLDDADVVLLDEHAQPRGRPRESRAGRVHSLRPFDDAVTRIWSRAANLRACR